MKPTFFCIGAQKAGTTTLHYLLCNHPELCISTVKEVPFFTREDRVKEGWEKYVRNNFNDCDKKKLGTISPQYMCSIKTARDIHRVFPKVKIIAILRDPIERSISHYKMCIKRGSETRTFSKVLEEELHNDKINLSRKIVVKRFENYKEINCYFVWGEYGRLLKPYYDLFPSENILVLFSHDLKESPKEVIHRISNFLDIKTIIPDNINNKYHVTQISRYDRLFNNIENRLKQRKFASVLPKKLVKKYKSIKERFRTNTVTVQLTKDEEKKLRCFFFEDLTLLKEGLGIKNIPWEQTIKPD